MLSRLSCIFSFVCIAALALPAAAGEKSASSPVKGDEEKIASILNLLETTQVNTKPFQKPLPLEKVLTLLVDQLPAGKKFAIRVQAGAFGEEAAKLVNVAIQFKSGDPISLRTFLNSILSQARKEIHQLVEIGIGAEGVIFSTPKLAAFTLAYDVDSLVQEVEGALGSPELGDALRLAGLPADLVFQRNLGKAGDGKALLRLAFMSVEPRPFESVQLRNGAQLIVHATLTRHQELADLLASLRRLTDVAVVLNARLIEVDRAFFIQHVTPLLGKEDRPIVPLSFDSGLLDKLGKEKLLLRGDEAKLRPEPPRLVLSLHEAFRFSEVTTFIPAKGLPEPKKEKPPTFIGSTGVAIHAKAEVSSDRRFVRLEITQKVDELVEIRKTRFGSPDLGFEVIEEPSLKKNALTTSIKIPDNGTILMPIAFRPPGKDRVWLFVAEPRIWIQEEVDAFNKVTPNPGR